MVDWEPADTSTYSADQAVLDGFTVTVCLDDEGPLRPAYFWDVTDAAGERVTCGWAPSVAVARDDALTAARVLTADSTA